MSRTKQYFELEDLRTKLALTKRYVDFKKTYLESTKINKNTGKFWDEKFNSDELLKNQDGMTKDKINFITTLLPKERSKILDLGIGQGYLEQKLKDLNINHEIFGIDISQTSIKRIKKKFKGKFIVGNINSIDRYHNKASFDVIIAIEVIEHIAPPNIFNLYKKIHSLLKPHGIFIVSTPLNEGLKYMKNNPSAHLREYTIPILKTEFKLSKFKVLKIKTHYAFIKLYFLKKIIAKILPSRWKPNNIIIYSKKI